MDQMPERLKNLSKEIKGQITRIIGETVKGKGQRLSHGGREWSGTINHLGENYEVKGYIDPYQELLRFMVDGWGPIEARTGYAIVGTGETKPGKDCPEWAILSFDIRKNFR
jgi:hypothetical protein